MGGPAIGVSLWTRDHHHFPSPFLSQDFLDGVSSHAVANIGNYIWLYGGLTFSKGPLDTLARYMYCHITLVKPLPENN